MLTLSFLRYTQTVLCPICDREMVMLNRHGYGICPKHGEIAELDIINTRGMSKLDTLIEIRCEQAKHEISLMAEDARNDIFYVRYLPSYI